MKRLIEISILLFSLSASGQNAAPSQVFPSAQIRSQLSSLATEAKQNGSSGATLGDFGSHAIKLSERTASGGAEVHLHFDDILVILSGKATVVTGGELLDPHSGNNGEMTGTGIRNGLSKVVSSGDVIHIPAGTPHQFIVAPGNSYSSLVIKVKE